MKTAVSVPDPIFSRADRLAKHLRMSRSQLYTEALSEFVARHEPAGITEAMNAVCDALQGGADSFVTEAARRALKRTEW